MIISETEWSSMDIVESDVTVIGAGAAGITLALDLEKKGFKVNLFEGG